MREAEDVGDEVGSGGTGWFFVDMGVPSPWGCEKFMPPRELRPVLHDLYLQRGAAWSVDTNLARLTMPVEIINTRLEPPPNAGPGSGQLTGASIVIAAI